eukprot:2054134-Prymnesium_polylepis.1
MWARGALRGGALELVDLRQHGRGGVQALEARGAVVGHADCHGHGRAARRRHLSRTGGIGALGPGRADASGERGTGRPPVGREARGGPLTRVCPARRVRLLESAPLLAHHRARLGRRAVGAVRVDEITCWVAATAAGPALGWRDPRRARHARRRVEECQVDGGHLEAAVVGPPVTRRGSAAPPPSCPRSTAPAGSESAGRSSCRSPRPATRIVSGLINGRRGSKTHVAGQNGAAPTDLGLQPQRRRPSRSACGGDAGSDTALVAIVVGRVDAGEACEEPVGHLYRRRCVIHPRCGARAEQHQRHRHSIGQRHGGRAT